MKRTLARKLGLLVSISGLYAGCANDRDVDIGHTAAQLSDFAAKWDGYAEAKTFEPSGSDRVRLAIDPSGEGTMEVGDGAALPVPAHAEGGYLLDPHSLDGSGAYSELLREGWKFSVHEARVESGRIRFGIDPLELFGPWCKLTPAFPNGGTDSGYACGTSIWGENTDLEGHTTCEYSTSGVGSPSGQVDVVVDCGILHTCAAYNPCTCTASGCGPHVVAAGTSLDRYDVIVDAAISNDGQSLTGTLAIKMSSDSTARINVRMTKTP